MSNERTSKKDLFVQKISSKIFNYKNDYGTLVFTLKFNSGDASVLTINTEERIMPNDKEKPKVSG